MKTLQRFLGKIGCTNKATVPVHQCPKAESKRSGWWIRSTMNSTRRGKLCHTCGSEGMKSRGKVHVLPFGDLSPHRLSVESLTGCFTPGVSGDPRKGWRRNRSGCLLCAHGGSNLCGHSSSKAWSSDVRELLFLRVPFFRLIFFKKKAKKRGPPPPFGEKPT